MSSASGVGAGAGPLRSAALDRRPSGRRPLGSYKRHALEPIFGVLVDCFMQRALINTRRLKNSHPAQHPDELGVSFDDMIRWTVYIIIDEDFHFAPRAHMHAACERCGHSESTVNENKIGSIVLAYKRPGGLSVRFPLVQSSARWFPCRERYAPRSY